MPRTLNGEADASGELSAREERDDEREPRGQRHPRIDRAYLRLMQLTRSMNVGRPGGGS